MASVTIRESVRDTDKPNYAIRHTQSEPIMQTIIAILATLLLTLSFSIANISIAILLSGLAIFSLGFILTLALVGNWERQAYDPDDDTDFLSWSWQIDDAEAEAQEGWEGTLPNTTLCRKALAQDCKRGINIIDFNVCALTAHTPKQVTFTVEMPTVNVKPIILPTPQPTTCQTLDTQDCMPLATLASGKACKASYKRIPNKGKAWRCLAVRHRAPLPYTHIPPTPTIHLT